MKFKTLACLLWLSLLTAANIHAQNAKSKSPQDPANYPKSFSIAKNELDHMFTLKAGEKISAKNNRYINGAVVKMNTINGDMKFLKLKLKYFNNAELMVQVNRTVSTQLVLASDDHSVFYKGHLEKNKALMNKCLQDDIVNE